MTLGFFLLVFHIFLQIYAMIITNLQDNPPILSI